VTQAKSGATLAAKDLMNMLTRIPPESVGSAFWIVHSSFLPETWSLAISNQPVYVNDLRVSPYGALLGRPVFVSEYCSSYNTLGDVYLFSPDGYLAAMKGAGIRTDVSIHFFFDQAVQAFRSYMRIGGTPLASAAIARKNGSLTLSHIINLQVRS
jgi:HK97 family phage major capsid protein